MSGELSCELSNSDYLFNTLKLKKSFKEDYGGQKETRKAIILPMIILINSSLLRLIIMQKNSIINVVLLSLEVLK